MGALPTKTEVIDIVYRSGWTYAAAFFGSFFDAVIQHGIDDLTLLLLGTILRTAAFSALFTLAKAYISNKNGTGTATTRETPVVGPPPVASTVALPAL